MVFTLRKNMYFLYVECSQPLGAQQDPLELELDEGSHRTLIILVCRCMSCYIQRHLSAYSQTRNVPVRVELQERYKRVLRSFDMSGLLYPTLYSHIISLHYIPTLYLYIISQHYISALYIYKLDIAPLSLHTFMRDMK